MPDSGKVSVAKAIDRAHLEEYRRALADATDQRDALLDALRELRADAGVASDDAMCHVGITTRTDCGRCKRIDAADRAIAKAEGR